MDPISIRDVLHYLVAAADSTRVPGGAYDILGPETTSYGELLRAYVRISRKWRAELSVPMVDASVVSWMTAALLPVPGGRLGIDDAISRALSSDRPRPVNELADPHHLADTDPPWAGGDAVRIQQLARAVTPPIVLISLVPKPSPA